MNAGLHRAKAERIERSLHALRAEHFEAIIEGAMLAGTHWFNLLLHRAGVLTETSDAMHAEFLTLGTRRRVHVRLPRALEAMDRIEALRTTHVRGDMPNGIEAAKQALDALALLGEMALLQDSDGVV